MRTSIFIFIFVFSILAIFYFLFSHSDLSSETFIASIDSSSGEFLETTLSSTEPVKEPVKHLPYIKVYTPDPPQLRTYVEITTGCTTVVDATCVKVFATTSTNSAVRAKLRVGSVFFVDQTVTAPDGTIWYSVFFDESLRFSDRLTLPWFIQSSAGEIFSDIGELDANASTTPGTKRLLVDRGDQMLYAYDGDTLFMETPVSTGLLLTPTPRGTFTVFMKTPTRYMQGPIPGISDQYYDLPGVPWNLYFTKQGAVIHGAYWHNSFGKTWSHGCVNLPPDIAKKIYLWADIGMTVTIRD